MKRIQEEHVLVAISTCTYRHKYWEFWRKQYEVWPGIPLFMSWSFVFNCFGFSIATIHFHNKAGHELRPSAGEEIYKF